MTTPSRRALGLGLLASARPTAGTPSSRAACASRRAGSTGSCCATRAATRTTSPPTTSPRVCSRGKVQVTQHAADGWQVILAEFKGAIREIEVYPGHAAEWWLVPVATGRITDLRCGIVAEDGRTHAQHGMVGEILIE